MNEIKTGTVEIDANEFDKEPTVTMSYAQYSELKRIQGLGEMVDEIVPMIKSLKNREMWKTGGRGGQDKYAGLPAAHRLIDDILRKLGHSE